jgi:hypothetical protein
MGTQALEPATLEVLMNASDPGRFDPAVEAVAQYADYAAAQRAIDFLSDNKFPVHQVTVVGEDVRLVEHVLGRLTTARAAGAGALSGLWFGLLIGLLVGIFTTAGWLWLIIGAALIGAAWGAVFGAIGHAMTGGQRDFQSVNSLVANRYTITVPREQASAARQLLAELTARDRSRAA